jgi:hypothetical protein
MKYSFLVFAALLSFAGKIRAQSDGLNTLMEGFESYRSHIVQEKIFVNTDKPDYLAGEIIWFKVYCLDAGTRKPLDLSKVCYVDVLDRDDKFVLQAKIAMINSEGRGSFYLPLTLASGNYKLRAYTNWMKNFGPANFFERPVTIVNTLKELPAAAPAVAEGSDTAEEVSFFPEGGNLVQGIRSIVAFRVTDREGAGRDCKGVVVDESNDTVASFAALRFGIGRFSFRPETGHSYRASIRVAGEPIVVRALPAAYDKGYVLHAGDAGDAGNKWIKLSVYARKASSETVYLFGHSGQGFRMSRRVSLSGDSAEFLIARDSLGEGVTQLTLFDGELRPVCERLLFRRPEERVSIDVSTDSPQYGVRKKISLGLSVSDQKIRIAGEGAMMNPASLTLSVYRLDSLSDPSGMDMRNYLWMGSELRGRIESPDYYFTASGPEADEALDNLFLTHGWRRFRWEEHTRETPSSIVYPPEYSGHIISGRITDMRTGAPIAHRIVSLSSPGIDYRFRAAITDSSGRIVFDMREFYGQGGLVVHTGQAADSPAKVDIFSPFSEQYGGEKLPAFTLSDEQRQSLLDRSLNMQVQNIFTNDSLQRFHAPHVDSLHFFNIPTKSYLLDDYTRFTTMEEVLREYVSEINVNRPHGRLHILMLDEPNRQFFDDDNNLVLLDGIPVPDDKIFFYDPLKVKRLEVVSRRYYLGPAAYSGIASFTTYKGDYEGLELDRHCTLLDYDGLQWQREFYAPVYETPEQHANRLPDFRTVLFWSPDVHVLGSEKKEFSFYSSDLPGTYLIVAQGISADGNIGYKDLRIQVK